MMQIRPLLWIVTFNLLIQSPASASLVVNGDGDASLSPRFVRQAPKIQLSDLSPENWVQKRSTITLDGETWILDWVGQHTQPISITFPNHTLNIDLLDGTTLLKQPGNISFASYEVTVTDKKTGETPRTVFEFYLIVPNKYGDLEISSHPMYIKNNKGEYVDAENDGAPKRPHSL